MASFKARTIKQTPLYDACVEALGVDCMRLDEVLEGITFKIAIEPKFFPQLAGTQVRRARTQEFPPDIPSFRIWFTFDSQTVFLELIEVTPADELPVPEQEDE